MWHNYLLTLHVDRLAGGIPRHPDLVRRWQEARWPTNPERALEPGDPATADEAAERTIGQLGDQTLADEEMAGVWTGFLCPNGGELMVEDRQVKAMLKESANIVKTLSPHKALRAKLAERVFVSPRLIGTGRKEPDETVERAIRVMTRLGPRSALKRVDVLHDVTLHCELRVLDDRMITEDVLTLILDHAALNGLGTDRSQGYGTFSYVLDRQ